ncbi:MAG TPA: dTDP-4-dehydrorhamnose reductase [Longimicrobium sp.]|nr:dTDP-4-dehydrorhamnose reductase [Longimicrobium sp.]
MTRPTILVTGGTGQVGWELARALAPLGRVVTPGRDELDLADEAGVRAAVRRLAPALVVSAGAHTAVDRAESEPELARAINAAAPGALAEEAARLGAPIVHFSTDYVFDGAKATSYTEADAPNPLGVYGRTKLEGERAVAAAGGPHLVLRTSWVYGARGHNFMRTMLRLAREREELRVVADRTGAPTWSRMLAEAVAAIVASCRVPNGFAIPREQWGVYHLAAGGSTTWHGFAEAIVAGDPARHEQRCRRVVPIATEEYPTPAPRPRRSTLDGARAERSFGVSLPDWREQLALCMEP